MGYVDRKHNEISIDGDFNDSNLHYLLATLHKAVEDSGYSDLVLNFENCTSAFPSSMVGVCAQVMQHRNFGVDISVKLPNERKLSSLFVNTNWAHFLDPRTYDPSKFRGHTHIPVTQYQTPEEHHQAVNKIVSAILGAVPNIERASFGAFEWSINEITDNVLTHSESPIGGLVQVSTFQKKKNIVQFIVADPGRGIPNTLRETHKDLSSDTEALDQAIRRGVTRDIAVGQGNGLFGSYQICSHCKGAFQVTSGHAKLLYNEKNGLKISNENVPFDGTLIVANIDFSKPDLLDEALEFGGERYTPTDYVETNYEIGDNNKIIFTMKDEAESFGTRPAGTPVRTRLKNIQRMSDTDKIIIDFVDIPFISSSFADEVFGKLFFEVGPLTFMQCFEFTNISRVVRSLIDKAIAQRMAVGKA